MGFLERAIRRGISEGVGKAVGSAVEKAVTPRAAALADKTAAQLDQAAGSASRQSAPAVSGLEGAFSNLQRAAEGYATEMSKNFKICPACGESALAEQHFCPKCGAKLPEETAAQSAVCPDCGRQNTVGTRFCAGCGAKLPGAEAEERAARQRADAAMAQWDALLSRYPRWCCGGTDYHLELQDGGRILFAAVFPDSLSAQGAVRQYRALLAQNGFSPAGQYPDPCQLYKMADGVCCHVDTEHCFDGDAAAPSLYFDREEPYGGFHYVKPEPKKSAGILGLFK